MSWLGMKWSSFIHEKKGIFVNTSNCLIWLATNRFIVHEVNSTNSIVHECKVYLINLFRNYNYPPLTNYWIFIVTIIFLHNKNLIQVKKFKTYYDFFSQKIPQSYLISVITISYCTKYFGIYRFMVYRKFIEVMVVNLNIPKIW